MHRVKYRYLLSLESSYPKSYTRDIYLESNIINELYIFSIVSLRYTLF